MLATAGSIAIHTIIAVCGDAIVVLHPVPTPPPVPHVELVDVEVPPIVMPPPPPIERAPAPQIVHAIPTATPRPRAVTTPQISALPPPVEPPQPTSGGDQVVSMPEVGAEGTGVGVAIGPRATGHIGRGGNGGGTAAGTGAGSADPPPAPVSIATIKTRAMPRGDYGYFDASKDYPAEARQLGIEGAIRVRLIVDDAGKVKASQLLNGLGHGLDELALHRAALIEFEPARDTDNKPVTSVVVWTFTMTLPK